MQNESDRIERIEKLLTICCKFLHCLEHVDAPLGCQCNICKMKIELERHSIGFIEYKYES